MTDVVPKALLAMLLLMASAQASRAQGEAGPIGGAAT